MNEMNRAQRLLIQLIKGASPSADEIIDFGKQQDARSMLISLHDDLRMSTLKVLIDLGRPVLPADQELMIPERQGPIVTDQAIICFLVGLLGDSNERIRNRACAALAELTPSSSLAPHRIKILSAIRMYPEMDGALILLGKTGSKEALHMLDSIPALCESSSDDAIMVRARLGEQKAEEALLKAYRASTDPREKGALALRLGYASTGKTLMLLAEEMRSPDFYYWNKRSRCSLRLHIIEGLHLAYPTEPLFWEPFSRPTDDSYYKAIEDWLVKTLKVSWKHARPPFLYREDAPVGR